MDAQPLGGEFLKHDMTHDPLPALSDHTPAHISQDALKDVNQSSLPRILDVAHHTFLEFTPVTRHIMA